MKEREVEEEEQQGCEEDKKRRKKIRKSGKKTTRKKRRPAPLSLCQCFYGDGGERVGQVDALPWGQTGGCLV